jgi:hypothetical protein
MAEQKKYPDPEIPVEFKMRYTLKEASEKLRSSYEAWRIFILDSRTGEVSFLPNNSGDDWLSERNARMRASQLNERNKKYNWQENITYVVRRCKVNVEEI